MLKVMDVSPDVLMERTWRAVEVEPQAGVGFAEAGGDSLALMNLVFRLEAALGLPIPLDRVHTEMDAATMAQVVRDIAAGVADTTGGGGAGTKVSPVFLLPGIGGDEPRLVTLRAQLAPDLPMVALAYPEWTRLREGPRPRLATIIGHLVDQIEVAAPAGPVRLAGYSYGCRIAHAVADALVQRGRRVVGPVLLLDGGLSRGGGDETSGVFGSDDAKYSLKETAARRAVRWLERPGREWALRRVAGAPRRWLGGRFGFYLRKYMAGVLLGPPLRDYRPGFVDVSAVLFRSQEHPAGSDRFLGWTGLWRSVRVLDVPGDHVTMLDGAGLDTLCAGLVAVSEGGG